MMTLEHFENIPKELKDRSNWVLWKKEKIDGRDKPTKVPYQINGKKALSNKPDTWTNFPAAVSAYKAELGKYDGIGFCLTEETPIGIDLDHCRCPAFVNQGIEIISSWAQEIINKVDSYTEASPSGKGIRIFANGGKLPAGGRKKGDFEIYQSGRYLTVTGNHIEGTPKDIMHRPETIEAVFNEFFGTVKDKGSEEKTQPKANMNVTETMERAFNSKNGDKIRKLYNGDHSDHRSQSEADLVLCSHLAFWLGNDAGLIDTAFRESGLYRPKWDEKHHADGSTYGQSTIKKAIEGNRETYIGGNERGAHATQSETGDEPEKPKQTQAEVMLDVADEKIVLFHDEQREPFCSMLNRSYPLKAVRVKDFLSYEFYKRTGRAPNSDAIIQAINTLRGKALYEVPMIKLHNRLAFHDRSIWYDMADGTGIKFTADQWEHIEKVPILFRNYSHQKKQTVPSKDGRLWDVFDFLNVESKNQLLVAVYIVSCFIPDIPHPIFHPHGAQGSGKTTFCRVLKELVDPSELSTLIMQRDYAQLIQAIAHHHFVPFDNLSDLPGWASDILAIACTGGGLSKRQLYTDEDDVVLSVRRCIGINAINLLIQRADLMDRAILLHLDRIEPSRRKDETQFWIDFEHKKAGILGGIFNTLARAMAIYPKVKLECLPRMADFAKWGYAIGEAIRHGGGDEFLKSYADNIAKQNEEIILNNTLIINILKEMSEKSLWEGTIKTVYQRLVELAVPDKHDPTFPKTERKLRAHLERAKTTLAQQGIHFTIGERTSQGIPITFRRTDYPEYAKSSTLATLTTHNEQNQTLTNVDKNVANASTTQLSTQLKSLISLDNEDDVANVDNFPNLRDRTLDFTGETFEVLS